MDNLDNIDNFILDTDFSNVLRLARDVVSRSDAKMKWMWGEALLGYALSELDKTLGTEMFTPFLTAYCDYYVKHPPQIDYADRAAPALITYVMQKKTGKTEYQALTNRVLDYIRYEDRLIGDAVNHLGNSPESRFYPKSIWVDSLMMFGVFPALYAHETNDSDLLDIAARQPQVYSQYMQDPHEKLWYHSYWVKAGRHHPRGKVFWGRGNGWVVCALPIIMDYIGREHPEFEGIRKIFCETVQAVLLCKNPDNTFNTLLQKKSYRELSATALISSGILRGVRQGYLPHECLADGEAIFHAVASSIGEDEHGIYLPEISGPTIPLHILPELCYRLTPKAKNWSYGLAACIFAAIEHYKMVDLSQVQ